MADDRRFALKADAFYVRHDDGVWLRNNRGSFTIRGDGSYPLIASLFSRLDGRRSVAEICADLPAPARRPVTALLGTLHRNGFVKELHHPPEEPPDWMRDRYPTHLAFLDHHGDRPVTRLCAVRATPVACAGSGVALRAAAGALAEFGFARVTVVVPEAEAAAVADVVATATGGDPDAEWQVVTVPEPAAGLDGELIAALPELRTAAYVLLAVDDADPAELAGLQVTLHTQGRPTGVLGRCGDRVVALPGAELRRCWECAWRRLSPPVAGDAAGLVPAVTPATIGALHLAQRAFAHLAGVSVEDADVVATVEPLAPVVRVHAVPPHPLCHHHRDSRPDGPRAPEDGPVRPDLPFAEDEPALVAVSDRIVAVTGGWTDRCAGPLLSVGEGAIDQLPLAASACRIPDPAATAGRHADEEVLCRAVSPREARNQVVLFALERLAARTAALLGRPGRIVYGAGWSIAEAEYRTLLAASRAAPGTDRSWHPPAGRDDRPLRAFLIDTLAAADRHWSEASVEQLPTGLVRARLRTTAGPEITGVGVDEQHATDQALLHAVAALRPDTGNTVVAHLAPPAATWAAAARHGARLPLVDAGALLPFLDGRAQLTAVELPGEWT